MFPTYNSILPQNPPLHTNTKTNQSKSLHCSAPNDIRLLARPLQPSHSSYSQWSIPFIPERCFYCQLPFPTSIHFTSLQWPPKLYINLDLLSSCAGITNADCSQECQHNTFHNESSIKRCPRQNPRTDIGICQQKVPYYFRAQSTPNASTALHSNATWIEACRGSLLTQGAF